jgi:pre-mRNA cleavage complex 2 protein Pcf11
MAATPAAKAERRAALLKKWVPVPSDPAKAATPCPICKEPFQSEFAEDEEEWIWRNAVKVENQVRRVHVGC